MSQIAEVASTKAAGPLHQVFEQTVDRTGDAVALECGQQLLTYAELDRRANQLAHLLAARGIGCGARVGLLFERSAEMYVSILAVLKAGGAFVPIDPTSPQDRVAFIQHDVGLRLIITQERMRSPVGSCRCAVLPVDASEELISRQPGHRLEVAPEPEDLCYISYTSGSTGRPKGVAISHRSISNFLSVAAPVYGVAPHDRAYQGMSISFDFSVEEIWLAWSVGAAVVAGPTDARRLGPELRAFLAEKRITFFCCVPTLLATMDRDVPTVRTLLVGGEACPADLVRRWARPGRRMLNTYGPPETTVTATWTELTPGRAAVTIGTPLPTYRVYILDEKLRPLPRGGTGEICIGGPGVAAGYINRDDVTADRFVPNPVTGDRDAPRIYRTGDLGRITADEEIEYLGRIDTQVKIGGRPMDRLREPADRGLRLPLPDRAPGPAVFRAAAAAPERTLVDVFECTVAGCPDALALDDGRAAFGYRALAAEVGSVAARLRGAGIGAGDRVGIRVPSGTAELYVAILGVLAAGAAYVPVDVDDPDERARLVWSEAGVCAVLGAGLALTTGPGVVPGGVTRRPGPDDDAWIIFTSGSTGKPKGVAISHRSAAAFVDAEAALFVRGRPLGPGDRVLAGLSVAFDASCEEMWLAWRHGGCLVPAPRALVRAGADLGGWLARRRVSVVSTVPTLAALWPRETIAHVRLLILGGEACPGELAARLCEGTREVWNTYGPTEATVVACAAPLSAGGPVRIGLPLDGWQLAVLDPGGQPVAWGQTGELVIGGVGLGRYLDPARDRQKYAPVPSLGWKRGYRSGDLVRADPAGLVFVGRADDQVKLGGRRIELGEVDAALRALPGVRAAAAAVKTAGGGARVLAGYVVPEGGAAIEPARARQALARQLPAALVPRVIVVDSLPTRTSGKVDRAALPWPPPDPAGPGRPAGPGAWRARPACSPPAGRSCSASRWTTSTRTSSPSAARAWRPPSWSPRCAGPIRGSQSPISTSIRCCVSWPAGSASSPARGAAGGWSARRRAGPAWPGCWCCCSPRR